MQHQKKSQLYDTDLTDRQWQIIEPLIPPAKQGGRPRQVDIREVINAIFYLLKTGCQWRMLPKEYPNWPVVYHYFKKWKQDGTWKNIHDRVRGYVRKSTGKNKQPSAGIIDSQSVKSGDEKGGFVAMTLARK